MKANKPLLIVGAGILIFAMIIAFVYPQISSDIINKVAGDDKDVPSWLENIVEEVEQDVPATKVVCNVEIDAEFFAGSLQRGKLEKVVCETKGNCGLLDLAQSFSLGYNEGTTKMFGWNEKGQLRVVDSVDYKVLVLTSKTFELQGCTYGDSIIIENFDVAGDMERHVVVANDGVWRK